MLQDRANILFLKEPMSVKLCLFFLGKECVGSVERIARGHYLYWVRGQSILNGSDVTQRGSIRLGVKIGHIVGLIRIGDCLFLGCIVVIVCPHIYCYCN